MRAKLSVIDPSVRPTARAWGRNAAFNLLSKIMLALLFVAILAATALVGALFRYLQAPKWVDGPGPVFVLGFALGCAAIFSAAAYWRWKLFRFVVRNAWWPYVAAYRGVKTE